MFRPCQNGLFDRECQQGRQVLKDPVADHDRLVARIDADMDMQAERHQPPGCFLEQLDQAVVALVRGDFWSCQR